MRLLYGLEEGHLCLLLDQRLKRWFAFSGVLDPEGKRQRAAGQRELRWRQGSVKSVEFFPKVCFHTKTSE